LFISLFICVSKGLYNDRSFSSSTFAVISTIN
jgi:hypothetical protein